MHAAPLCEQLWIVSSVDWQSLSLPQAAACFAQVLSTHLPQSVFPKEADGGEDAGGDSELGLAAAVSAGGGEADADAAGLGDSAEPAGSDELVAEALSSAGLSGGLVPPPHASQASGNAAMRAREETDR
jgi:hypothetical protein